MTRWFLVGVVMVTFVTAAPALGQPSPTCGFEPAATTLSPGDTVEVALTAAPDAWDGWQRITADGVAVPALDVAVTMNSGVFTYTYDEVVVVLRAATGSPTATSGTVVLGFSPDAGGAAVCTLAITLEDTPPVPTTSTTIPTPTTLPPVTVQPRFTG